MMNPVPVLIAKSIIIPTNFWKEFKEEAVFYRMQMTGDAFFSRTKDSKSLKLSRTKTPRIEDLEMLTDFEELGIKDNPIDISEG